MLVLKVNRDWSFGGEEVPRISLFGEYSLLPPTDNHFRHLSAVIYPRLSTRTRRERERERERDIALRRSSGNEICRCRGESRDGKLVEARAGANAISTRFFFNIQPTANVGEQGERQPRNSWARKKGRERLARPSRFRRTKEIRFKVYLHVRRQRRGESCLLYSKHTLKITRWKHRLKCLVSRWYLRQHRSWTSAFGKVQSFIFQLRSVYWKCTNSLIKKLIIRNGEMDK